MRDEKKWGGSTNSTYESGGKQRHFCHLEWGCTGTLTTPREKAVTG